LCYGSEPLAQDTETRLSSMNRNCTKGIGSRNGSLER
jgi:hypothetical protein